VLNALRHQRLGNGICGFAFPGIVGVLNALRHQRLGNTIQEAEQAYRARAQRLAASTVGKRLAGGSNLRLGEGAQRLAASTVGKLVLCGKDDENY